MEVAALNLGLVNTIYQHLQEYPHHRPFLEEMVGWEEAHPAKDQWDGWKWQHVHTPVGVVNHFIAQGIVNLRYDSNKSSYYRLVSVADTKEALGMAAIDMRPKAEAAPDVSNLFGLVVGHERVKALLRYAIQAEKPTHFLLVGQPGSVPGDERVIVLSDAGVERVPIRDVWQRFESGECFHALSVNPVTFATEWRAVTSVFRHESNEDTLEVRLMGGRTIRATANHSFLQYDPIVHQIVPVIGQELEVGDILPVGYSWSTVEGSQRVRIGDSEEELDHELGLFVGVWLADGSLCRGRVYISNSDEELLGRCRVRALALAKAGTYYKGGAVHRFPGKAARQYVVGHRALHDFLGAEFAPGEPEAYGVKGRYAGLKRLPPWAFTAPEPFVVGLLRGYFTGDGSITKRDSQICAYSLSPNLLEDIALLLQRFGILATLTPQSRGYRLRIPKEFTIAFMAKIGFLSGKGAHYHPDPVAEDQIFALPLPANPITPQQLRTAFQHAGRSGYKWVSRFVGSRLAQAVVDFEHIKTMYAAPVVWMRISGVRRVATKNPVYDLCVDGNESFALDGSVFVHNTAKTLLLSDIARLPAAEMYVGSTTTKAGLVGLLLMVKPRYLVLDELDKMQQADMGPLLNLMETGMVTRLQHRIQERITMDTRVFAGANDITKIPAPILSRFAKMEFPPYTPEEFVQVATAVLSQREGQGPAMAELIAREVAKHSTDIRDAVRVARLARNDPRGVMEVVRCLWKVTPIGRR